MTKNSQGIDFDMNFGKTFVLCHICNYCKCRTDYSVWQALSPILCCCISHQLSFSTEQIFSRHFPQNKPKEPRSSECLRSNQHPECLVCSITLPSLTNFWSTTHVKYAAVNVCNKCGASHRILPLHQSSMTLQLYCEIYQ